MSTVVFRGGPADGRVEFKEDDPYTLMFTGFVNANEGPFFKPSAYTTITCEYRRTNELNSRGELIYDFIREF